MRYNAEVTKGSKRFWASCLTYGPERPYQLYGNDVEKIYANFWAWLAVHNGKPVPKPPVPTPPKPEGQVTPGRGVQGSPLSILIDQACAAVSNLHPCANELVRLLLSGQNCYLSGPAGCGKSYLCAQVAGILSTVIGKDIPLCDVQVTGPNWSDIDYLTKIMPTAGGKLESIPSPLLNGALNGGLVFIDELDLATAESNVGGLNTILASRRIYHPLKGETIDAHSDFYFISAGNTDLRGPTPEFPARCAQDSSLISRFAAGTFQVGYSEALEKKILEPRVCKLIHDLRKKIAGKGCPVELSTRLGADMTRQLAAGLLTFDQVVHRWKQGLSADIQSQLFGGGK